MRPQGFLTAGSLKVGQLTPGLSLDIVGFRAIWRLADP